MMRRLGLHDQVVGCKEPGAQLLHMHRDIYRKRNPNANCVAREMMCFASSRVPMPKHCLKAYLQEQ